MKQTLAGFVTISLVACLLGFSGCGSGPKTYPVKGKLTIKGQPPSKDVSMSFQPEAEGMETASAVIEADGTYTLRTGAQGKPGAMAGKYKVVLAQAAGAALYAPSPGGGSSSAPPPPTLSFPPEYQSATTSPKPVEVKAGNNVIDIEIP